MSDSNGKQGTPITVAGRTLYVRSISPADDYREISLRIASRRRSPLDIVCAKLDKIPPEHRQDLLQRAFDQEPKFDDYASPEEIEQYLSTRDGLVFAWWLTVRDNHPDITLEQAGEFFKAINDAEFASTTASEPAPEQAAPAGE